MGHAVWLHPVPGKDVVGTRVDECGADRVTCARHVTGCGLVDEKGPLFIRFGGINRRIRRALDDNVGPFVRDARCHGRRVGHVQLRAREGDHLALARGEGGDQRLRQHSPPSGD